MGGLWGKGKIKLKSTQVVVEVVFRVELGKIVTSRIYAMSRDSLRYWKREQKQSEWTFGFASFFLVTQATSKTNPKSSQAEHFPLYSLVLKYYFLFLMLTLLYT